MKLTAVLSALGIILIAFGFVVLTPIIFAVADQEFHYILPFIATALFSISIGLACRWHGRFSRNFDTIRQSEGLLIVASTWIACGVIGAVPYLFFGLHPLDALFESVSGITTTGATILVDFSLYPKVFFFWRSLSQWLGGMGIIVLFVAVLPQLGVAGRKIFFAEAPGPTEDKITPRLAHTAKALWLVYLLLTIAEIGLLYLAGMPFFDALCNALSTMAAGGFSPNPLSIIGYQNDTITWIVTFFMFLAGGNFALQYRLFIQGKPRPLLQNEEFRFYSGVVGVSTFFLAVILFLENNYGFAASIRDSAFQIISIITTTGFSSADFALWTVPAQVILFSMMLFGGCAGSAGGGIKIVRILFGVKYLKREISQIIHPSAIIPVKIDHSTVPNDIQRQMIGFMMFYIVLLVLSSLVVTMIEGDVAIGIVGTAATLGNVGPGFGEIGPMGSFAGLSAFTKVLFIFNMIVGRLELIPFLAMLNPDFWSLSRGKNGLGHASGPLWAKPGEKNLVSQEKK